MPTHLIQIHYPPYQGGIGHFIKIMTGRSMTTGTFLFAKVFILYRQNLDFEIRAF